MTHHFVLYANYDAAKIFMTLITESQLILRYNWALNHE